MDRDELVRNLLDAPEDIQAAELVLLEREEEWRWIKARDVPNAEADLEAVEADQRLAAIRSGRVDGKNEATRAVQMAEVLAESKPVDDARKFLEQTRERLLDAETAMKRAQIRVNYANNIFRALLSVTAMRQEAPMA